MSRRHIIVLLIILMSRSLSIFADDVIVVSSSINNHPKHEYFTDILTEAYSRLGYRMEVRFYPLQRSVVLANSGIVDGELFRGDFDLDKYPDLIRVPVPLEVGELSVFTKNLDIELDGWKSLRPYRIAIHNGVKPAEYGTEGMDVIKVNNEVQLLKLLESDRIDLFIAPKDVIEKELQDETSENIICLEPPVEKDILYHYLHKDNQELIPKLVGILSTMQNEGYFRMIEP